MTLLTIAQNIARGTGLPVPDTIHGNNNQDARRLLQAINNAGRFLAQKDWVLMQKEVLLTITTVSAVTTVVRSATTTTVGVSATVTAEGSTTVSAFEDSYDFPSDYKAMVYSTAWNRTTRRKMGGPIRAQKWQNLKSGFTHIGIFDEFRIKVSATSKQFVISPIPTSPDIFVYEYRSTDWVLQSGGTTTESIWSSAGGDAATGLIDEYLLELEANWRFLKSIGQSFATDKQEARDQLRSTFGDDAGTGVVIAGYHSGQFDHFPAITPESSVGL